MSIRPRYFTRRIEFKSYHFHCQGMMELRSSSQNQSSFPPSPRVSPAPHVSSIPRFSPAPHVSSMPRELCMSWLQTGMCPVRGDCGSAHSLNELSSPSQQMTPSLRKPLCKNFRERGHCPYGNNCQFSHNQVLWIKHSSLIENTK